MNRGHVKQNHDGSVARCGGPGICPECSSELAKQQIAAFMHESDLRKQRENELLDIILQWQFAWMDVKGTTEEDAKNYRERSRGIDANMRYDLARRLMKAGRP